MTKLKSCPFCGGRADIELFDYSDECYLKCFECGIEQPIYQNLDEAIKAWNKRITENETKDCAVEDERNHIMDRFMKIE